MIIPHPKHPTGGYWMEQDLNDNIMVLPARVKKDKDVMGVFVGSPGEGKSTLAQQVLYPLDPTITIDSIKWTYEDYVKDSLALFQAGQSKGKGIIHDEGKESLSSASIMSRRTKKFMDFLYENRQMNMYQFILTGDFFDLPKSIVMNRVLFMIWVHEEGEFDNGYFKFFNREDLKRLYVLGKKMRNMQASKYSFRGRFPKFYTVDEDAYRKKKMDSMKPERYVEGKKEQKELTLTQQIEFILSRNPDVRPVDVCRMLSCDKSTFFNTRKKLMEVDGVVN